MHEEVGRWLRANGEDLREALGTAGISRHTRHFSRRECSQKALDIVHIVLKDRIETRRVSVEISRLHSRLGQQIVGYLRRRNICGFGIGSVYQDDVENQSRVARNYRWRSRRAVCQIRRYHDPSSLANLHLRNRHLPTRYHRVDRENGRLRPRIRAVKNAPVVEPTRVLNINLPRQLRRSALALL